MEGLKIFIVAFGMVGFTLLVFFSVSKGNILYPIAKPIKIFIIKHRKLRVLLKPLFDCYICMLFWYGSFFFWLQNLFGFVDWPEWLLCLGVAYGVIFIRNLF